MGRGTRLARDAEAGSLREEEGLKVDFVLVGLPVPIGPYGLNLMGERDGEFVVPSTWRSGTDPRRR